MQMLNKRSITTLSIIFAMLFSSACSPIEDSGRTAVVLTDVTCTIVESDLPDQFLDKSNDIINLGIYLSRLGCQTVRKYTVLDYETPEQTIARYAACAQLSFEIPEIDQTVQSGKYIEFACQV